MIILDLGDELWGGGAHLVDRAACRIDGFLKGSAISGRLDRRKVWGP